MEDEGKITLSLEDNTGTIKALKYKEQEGKISVSHCPALRIRIMLRIHSSPPPPPPPRLFEFIFVVVVRLTRNDPGRAFQRASVEGVVFMHSPSCFLRLLIPCFPPVQLCVLDSQF